MECSWSVGEEGATRVLLLDLESRDVDMGCRLVGPDTDGHEESDWVYGSFLRLPVQYEGLATHSLIWNNLYGVLGQG